MSTIGRNQRELFDSWGVAEVMQHIEKYQTELGDQALAFSTSQEAAARRAALGDRLGYLRSRLAGRTYVFVGEIGQWHATDCQVYRAVRGPVAIECKHGHDACPQCDVCNCALGGP